MLSNWCDSPKMEGLTAESERLLIRLYMNADDYGRFLGNARLLIAHCFPYDPSVTIVQVDTWLAELCGNHLIQRYEVDGRHYLAIVNFGQRLRQVSAKFPPPSGMSEDWLAIDNNPPQVASNPPLITAAGCQQPAARREGEGEGELEIEREEERKRQPAAAAMTVEQQAEKLRLAYPRQSHMRDALIEAAACIRRYDFQTVLAGTSLIAETVKQWTDAERATYIKRPDEFFRGDHWADDPSLWLGKTERSKLQQSAASANYLGRKIAQRIDLSK